MHVRMATTPMPGRNKRESHFGSSRLPLPRWGAPRGGPLSLAEGDLFLRRGWTFPEVESALDHSLQPISDRIARGVAQSSDP